MELIPVIDFDVAAQLVAIAQSGQQAWFSARFGPHNLAAPGDNAASGGLFVKLAAVGVTAVEIELRAAHIPFGLRGGGGRRSARLTTGAVSLRGARSAGGRIRRQDGTPILNPAIHGCAFAAHFEF